MIFSVNRRCSSISRVRAATSDSSRCAYSASRSAGASRSATAERKSCVLAGELAARAHRERAELLTPGEEARGDEAVARSLARPRELFGDCLGGRRVLRDSQARRRPSSPRSQRVACVPSSCARDRRQHARHDRANRIAGSDCGRDLGERGQRSWNGIEVGVAARRM